MLEMSERLREAALALLPVAGFFVALAVITKKRAVLAAWRRCRRETLTNLALTGFDVLFVLPLVSIPAHWLTAHSPFALSPAFWSGVPLIVTCLAAILVGDLVGYWRHRLEHSRLLWPAHATHHSDEAMNWLTLMRMHPLNRLSTVTIDVVALGLLGFPPAAVVVNLAVRNWWGFFIHADVRWTMGPLARVVISPAAHRVHHARDEHLAGSNFATVFSFWDRCFGTWHDPRRLLGVATGIEAGSSGFTGELLRPAAACRRFPRAIRRWAGSPSQSASLTKLSITRLRPPVSKSISSLFPSCAATVP